ncbi:hypothetical protein AB0M47_01565 [Hamadaea sp. NPDC051192]|uniref:WD40 repeat domain-containing protein n=1 Tax=Hamadaea sp. NPDC051192 TaxID=3154940 RepID=UPI00342300D5
MATDLYGIRVLDLAPDEHRVRFRVFVVYYDTEDRGHAPLPDDPSFFLRLLSENGLALDGIYDEAWVGANAHRYVRHVEQVATRNHPVADWARLHDFYYERNGSWRDEDLLAQADYDVEVTGPWCLGSLAVGHSWGSASYISTSDRVWEVDAPTVLDLREPAMRLDPFPGGETDDATPSDLSFSDDGEYLAMTSQNCELVVLRTGDWSEAARVKDSALWGQDIQWVPGTHQITQRNIEGGAELDGDAPIVAYDVDTGSEVDVAPQPREFRSRTGRYRADKCFGRDPVDGAYGAAVSLLTAAGESRLLHLPSGRAYAQGVSFTGDETRMFVGHGGKVHILDPETGRIIKTLNEVGARAVVRPDGAYVAASGDGKLIDLWRVSDGALLMRCRSGGRYLGGTTGLAWSPDGTLLAASVITGHDGYGGEVRIYRAGPPVELALPS